MAQAGYRSLIVQIGLQYFRRWTGAPFRPVTLHNKVASIDDLRRLAYDRVEEGEPIFTASPKCHMSDILGQAFGNAAAFERFEPVWRSQQLSGACKGINGAGLFKDTEIGRTQFGFHDGEVQAVTRCGDTCRLYLAAIRLVPGASMEVEAQFLGRCVDKDFRRRYVIDKTTLLKVEDARLVGSPRAFDRIREGEADIGPLWCAK